MIINELRPNSFEIVLGRILKNIKISVTLSMKILVLVYRELNSTDLKGMGLLSINRQINSLVVSYRKGNEFAVNDIFSVVNPLIENTSQQLEHLVTDATKFDCRIILKVRKLIETFDEENHEFLPAVKAIISKEKSDFIKRRCKKHSEVSMNLLEAPEDEEEPGFQFEDPKENVEDEVLYKEKVALLAEGDSKKELILNQWSKGANDKSISELLAQQYGGTAESNRVYISRFKTKCRNRLQAEANSHS